MRATASLFLLSAVTGGWLWAGGNASAAHATASISIVRPIVLRNTQSLYFGALLVEPGSQAGLIKQHAAVGGGTREGDPAGVTQVALSTDHWHNAEFVVQGEPDANFSVYLPKGKIQINSGSGPGSAPLFVPSMNYFTNSAIGANGQTNLWVGGFLNIPMNPAPGHYTAVFPVTVAYY